MISIKHGRGQVLEPFLNRVYGATSVRHVVLVSPWITHLEFLSGNSKQLLNRLGAGGTRVTVVTRMPDDIEHQAFISDVGTLAQAEIYYMPDLHAKYYVCHTTSRSFAVVGSPNMYRYTRRSFEIGVAIDGSGPSESLLNELDAVTIELRISQTSKAHKRIGAAK